MLKPKIAKSDHRQFKVNEKMLTMILIESLDYKHYCRSFLVLGRMMLVHKGHFWIQKCHFSIVCKSWGGGHGPAPTSLHLLSPFFKIEIYLFSSFSSQVIKFFDCSSGICYREYHAKLREFFRIRGFLIATLTYQSMLRYIIWKEWQKLWQLPPLTFQIKGSSISSFLNKDLSEN